jgi:LCCL domain
MFEARCRRTISPADGDDPRPPQDCAASLFQRTVAAAALVMLGIATAAPAAGAGLRWGNQGTRCEGTRRVDYARLWGLAWGTDWVGICKKTPASGLAPRTNGKVPSSCVQKADSSVWAEWRYSNHPSCQGGAAENLHWDNVGDRCEAGNRIEYARLWGLRPGTDWKGICQRTKADGVSPLSNGKVPSRCIDKGALGTWGEWQYSNHASCGARFEAAKKAGCFGPDRQVYSARLGGDLNGRSWEEACQGTVGPNGLGKPNRCVKDALKTGIWGEWYSQERCAVPLEWGSLKNNGCVKDLKTPDANAGGISLEGYRSYSAVLWKAGGDWLEACRFAPIRKKTADGKLVAMPFPTACVVADANDALSWATTAIIGAGTAFIAAPTGPYAIAASGAAIGVASKAAEAGLFEVWDTSLNVWGVFWVRDATCGGAAEAIAACPSTGAGLTGPVTCTCSAAQTRSGRVWGSGTYLAQSSVCLAARHAGVIPPAGGTVSLRSVRIAGEYAGSSRNGVTTSAWKNRDASFEFSGTQ